MTHYLRLATNFLGITESSPTIQPYLDDEIVFCKNNVCVHSEANNGDTDDVHQPGYLSIKSQRDEMLGQTLILTWIPNTTMKRHSSSLSAILPESPPSSNTSGSTSSPLSSSSPNTPPISPRKLTGPPLTPGVFGADLGMMRSVRFFYIDPGKSTDGHFVVASSEAQYKVLHFHNGGMDQLEQILRFCKFFARTKLRRSYREYTVIRPQYCSTECHPEDVKYSRLTPENWKQYFNSNGQIDDPVLVKYVIFFGGIEASLRPEVWPFLLKYFPFDSTADERAAIRSKSTFEYHRMQKARESMNEAERSLFYQRVQTIVEKDVVRTDRTNPFYSGDDNPNIATLQRVLLTYVWSHPDTGYSQGMSDLLAPILDQLRDEVDAFWCFEGLMQKTIFVGSPTDSDMDKQLTFLRALVELLAPNFYAHLQQSDPDAMEMLFCHRWILLCLKREFEEDDALQLWEACWSHYQTDYFHLFLCLAIILIYGDPVIAQNMSSDQSLLHFSTLANHMDVQLVLVKARYLLHKFRSQPSIPCCLANLCELCGRGMWDSQYVPSVHCSGHPTGTSCSYQPPY